MNPYSHFGVTMNGNLMVLNEISFEMDKARLSGATVNQNECVLYGEDDNDSWMIQETSDWEGKANV